MNFEPDVIWLHFSSDLIIALSYFSIPIALVFFARRRQDLAFNWMFLLFALFIILCGTTHLFGVWALWQPLYRLDGVVKSVTAVASAATAVLLWRLMPHALALPGPAELSRRKEELERLVEERTAELTRTNQALAREQAVLDGFLQAAPIGMGFWGNDMRLQRLNAALAAMHGMPAEAQLGRRVEEALPTLWPVVEPLHRRAQGGETIHQAGVSGETPAHPGEERHWLASYYPVRTVDGAAIGVGAVVLDVTDAKRAERERERLLSEAEAANRIKDEFLATLSHELRTPLNAIVGWTKILRMGKVGGDVEEGLEIIDRNAKAQAQLIEDLLDISRITSGKLGLEVQRVDLVEVIEGALDAVMPAAKAREVRLGKVLDTHAGPVSGDPTRLQQVVWNLLANAVKFTPKGGSVQVLLERVDSHVEIRVTDTGVGIHPDFLPMVFDRFRQADGSTTRRHGGLGLGLSIVKQLVEMHGGSVRVESPGEGRGATFTVALPISVVRPERLDKAASTWPGRGDAGAPDEGHSLSGLLILVVDDEPDARVLMKRVLKDRGAGVEAAGSVREALAFVEEVRPDVLISDIGMPGEDGYDLIRQVRDRLSAKELPAAALTAFARPEDRVRAMLAGFQVHMAKPVDPHELVAVVASLAARTGGGERL
jgi:PAS domain S-box-containing protein